MTGKIAPEQSVGEETVSEFCVQTQKQLPPDLGRRPKKVVVIAGPTATGKTELSLALAKAVDGEIISADSMQVYRGMDVGTAKATVRERSQVPHHMIDVRDIHEPFTVVDFYYEAREAIKKIHARNSTPIVVGGSGFYLHTLIYGPPEGPASVSEVRHALEEEMNRLGAERLYCQLQKLDPEYAATITQNDRQKIIRALEIITLSGGRVSDLGWNSRDRPLDYNFRCWFIYRPRELLYERIEARCDAMLAGGFMDEVIALEKAGIRENPSASQAIGYKQALEYLASGQSDADYTEFVRQFKQASRNYAKRQFTWFRKESLFRWTDVDRHDPELAVDMMLRDLESAL